jgi:Tetratricopeptide repeat
MRRALAIDEKSFGPNHPDVALNLNNLASLLRATDRLTEAEELMRRTLAIDEKSFGPYHRSVARDLTNLAGLRAVRGDWAESILLRSRAKPILIRRTESYGGDPRARWAKPIDPIHLLQVRNCR